MSISAASNEVPKMDQIAALRILKEGGAEAWNAWRQQAGKVNPELIPDLSEAILFNTRFLSAL